MLEKDTIPRIIDIQYLFEGLKVLSKGATFDDVRKALIEVSRNRTMRDGSITRTGYSAAKRLRVIDEYTYWANAKDVLSELIRLGLMKENAIPSKRKYVGIYRSSSYELSDQGKALSEMLFSEDVQIGVNAKDLIFSRMYRAHFYLRTLLTRLKEGRVLIPIYRLSSREHLKSAAEKGAILDDAVRWLVEEGREVGLVVDVDKFRGQVGQKIQMKVDTSSLVDAINEYTEQAFIESYGLHFDNVTFEHLCKLLRQFLVVNFTYHVPWLSGLMVYATAEIFENDTVRILRHGISEYASRVIQQIPTSFNEFKKPFVPIHLLRAAVCLELAINDEIFDYVIKGLVEGKYDSGYKVGLLRDVYEVLPPSAKPLTIGNEHYYTLAISQGGS
jgi:hypothetical protein